MLFLQIYCAMFLLCCYTLPPVSVTVNSIRVAQISVKFILEVSVFRKGVGAIREFV